MIRDLRYGFSGKEHNFDAFLSREIDNEKESSIRHFEIVYQHPGTMLAEVFEYWVDSTQGDQIVRYTMSSRNLENPDLVNAPYAITETSWIKQSEIWLPESVSMVDKGERLSLVFGWSSVNEPISEEKFTWEGLSLPKGTQVSDNSILNGVPVAVEIVGVNIEQPVPLLLDTQNNRQIHLLTYFAITVSGFLLGILIYFYYR